MRYIIPAALTFIVGLLLWQVQRERISLEYEIVESAPFPREQGTGKYFVIRLRNSGTKQIENVAFSFIFDRGTIDSKIFSEPGLVAGVSATPSELRGSIPLLNPRELLSATITMTGSHELSAPHITARAPGVTAAPRSDAEPSPQLLGLAVGSLVFALAVAGFAFYISDRSLSVSKSISQIHNLGDVSLRIEKTEEDLAERLKQQREQFQREMAQRDKEREARQQEHEQQMRELEQQRETREREFREGLPQTAQLIFAIFNRAGLSHRFPDLVGQAENVAYWTTGLFLMHSFLVDEPNREKYVRAAEDLVALPEMAPSSRGFNLYLLAKMEQFRNNSDGAIKWLDRCKSDTPLMYSHLMAQDPAYDLEALRDNLLRERHA